MSPSISLTSNMLSTDNRLQMTIRDGCPSALTTGNLRRLERSRFTGHKSLRQHTDDYTLACSVKQDSLSERNTSISSNVTARTETASDLPGPGRALGKLYSMAGRKIERYATRYWAHRLRRTRKSRRATLPKSNGAVRKFMRFCRINRSATSRQWQARAEPDGFHSGSISPRGILVISRTTSMSSMATVSNRPGAGRCIGNLYSRGGRVLERWVGRIAHDCGFGPVAVFQRLCDLMGKLEDVPWGTFGRRTVRQARQPELSILTTCYNRYWCRLLKYAL